MNGRHLLTVNAGSSSLKVALYRAGERETRLVAAQAERIGSPGSRLRLEDLRGDTLEDRSDAMPDHPAALRALLDQLRIRGWDRDLAAVGHRVVHGGDRYGEPRLIDAELIENLRGLTQVDPEHMPQALATMEATARTYPAVPQVACFDTAFHSRMPRVARLYALPRRFAEASSATGSTASPASTSWSTCASRTRRRPTAASSSRTSATGRASRRCGAASASTPRWDSPLPAGS